jgi:hypothetical protein
VFGEAAASFTTQIFSAVTGTKREAFFIVFVYNSEATNQIA